MRVEIVGETSGPFRPYYFEDPAFRREMASVPGAYVVREGTHYERLIVFDARLPSSRTYSSGWIVSPPEARSSTR